MKQAGILSHLKSTGDLLTGGNERARALQIGKDKARDVAFSYFDGVDQRMSSIGQIAQRTADEAVETRGVSEVLVALAHQMNELVGRFRLR